MSPFRLVLLIITVALTGPAHALSVNIDPEVSALNKINIAGRQRMLSQKIAKSVCFAALGIAKEAHLKEAMGAISLFEKSARAMRYGNDELQMLPEENDEVLSALDLVDEKWASYGGMLGPALASGVLDEDVLEILFRESLSVLRAAHAAVGVMEAQFGGSSMSPQFAVAINVAGRQRMLSQRAAKELCLLISGISPEENRKALRATKALFEDSLFALTFGSEEMNIMEPEVTLEWQFLDILNAWYYFYDLLEDQVAHDGEMSHEALERIARLSNIILVESNRAVSMYVRWATQHSEP